MIKIKTAAMCLAVSSIALATSTASEWHNPADIPVIEPVTVGLAGEQPADIVRYLMARGALQTRISPDGETVAFSYRVTGEPQLWLVDAKGGWPRQLTFGSAVSFFRWTPDNRQLLVGRDFNGNEREGYALLSADGMHERQMLPQSEAFRVFGIFSPDGGKFIYSSTERTGRDFDIYVADVASGKTRLVYQAQFGFYPRAWRPGSDTVIVDEVRGEDGNDVHLLDTATGKMTPLFRPAVASAYANYAWLPDGSGFYLATDQDREFSALARYSLGDGELEFLQTPDANIGNVTLSGDGRYLAWTVNEDGYSKLHVMDRKNDRQLQIPQLPPGVYSLEFSSAATALNIRVNAPGIPGDVHVWDVASNELYVAVSSTLAGLEPDTFVEPESLRYPARDGVELQGLLYLPQNARGKPPVLVKVHGGPSSQSRPTFQPQVQYLANNGIAVFDVNVRGSTGFGKTYARLDNREKRLDSVRDLVDTVAFLSKDERLNTNRIAVMGGSYGGYMVNAVLGSYPGVFDAGVSRVGVSDWVRALQDASPGLKASDRIEYGDIREQKWQEFYRVNSPINNAHHINVPLLVQHGVNDPRDPIVESDRLVTKIREAGGTVTYMRFPDEGHSITKQANRVAYYRTMASFLKRHLQMTELEASD